MIYTFANIGAFASVIAVYNHSGSAEISDFSGMWKRSPIVSAALMISLLSLAGIPPAAGFTGKFFLFTSIVDKGYLWIAFFGMAMSVVSIYYYINVIKVMLVGEVVDSTPIKVPMSLKLVMILSGAMTLVLGIYPGPVIEWANQVASQFIR
jgi:NADH-quinone oxidoreductase subunit N